MLSATFDDWRGRANDPALSVDLTSSMAIYRRTEILQIIHGNCCTSQGDPDSSFPLWGASTFSGVLYYSPAVWQTCDSSSASYCLCWCHPDNRLTLAKTLHHDTATINSEFIFSNLTDSFNKLFKKFILPTSGRTWNSRLFLLFFWSPLVMRLSQPMPSCEVTCLRNSHHEYFSTLSWTSSL